MTDDRMRRFGIAVAGGLVRVGGATLAFLAFFVVGFGYQFTFVTTVVALVYAVVGVAGAAVVWWPVRWASRKAREVEGVDE